MNVRPRLGARLGRARPVLLAEIQSRSATDPDGHAELAAQAIQRAMAIDPDYAVAHYAQGHLRS